MAAEPVPDIEQVVGEGFDAGSLFDPARRRGDVFSISVTSARDEADLISAAKEERSKKFTKRDRDSIRQIATTLLTPKDGGASFAERIGEVLRLTKVPMATVTVEYQDLTVEADALVGSAGNPSVGNSVLALAKRLTLQGGLSTKPYQILKGVNGVLKPGRLTLLLGPPASGKSVLLSVLAGRLQPSKHLRISGTLKYNGVPQEEFVPRSTIGLVEQYDNHIPNLSVLETVDFAGRCLTSKKRSKLAVAAMDAGAERLRKVKSMGAFKQVLAEQGAAGPAANDSEAVTAAELAAAENFDEDTFEALRDLIAHDLKPHLILRIMGLEHVADTDVGGPTIRGVSGGERKRVSTAEVMSGQQTCVLFDEISTGLDSATTFSVVKAFGDICHALQRTFLVLLLQPPPEVVQLFDDVVLLTDGQVLYHGPVDLVLPHFERVGFSCPVRKDPGSFLQEVTTPLGQMLYATPALLEACGVPASAQDPERLLVEPPKALLVEVKELADRFWRESEPGKQLMDQLVNHPFDPANGAPAALARTRFANGRTYLAKAVLDRQVTLNRRMKGYYIARIIQTIIMGLIIGSLFVNIDPVVAQGRNVLAVCTLSVMFLSMMSGPQLGMVFSTKRVFYKHRDANFFPSLSYSTGLMLTQVPQSTVEAVLFSVIVYWLVGFNTSASNFFIFLLVTWSASNCLAGLFRLFAYASPTMVLAQSVASLLLLLMMLTNGFSIVVPSIPWYIRWLYYLNPLAYAMKAIIINELTSSQWSYPVGTSGVTAGEEVLDTFGMPTETFWIWVGVGFQWVFLLILNGVGAAALRYMDPPSPRPTVTEAEQKKAILRQVKSRLFRMHQHSVSNEHSDPQPPQDKVLASLASQRQPEEKVSVTFTPITLVCRDVRYYVDDPSGGTAAGVVKSDNEDKEIAGKLELLKGINMFTKPGQLTALMGGSGAGKTTLMDVICGRKTQGIIRGEFLVNGYPKEQDTFSRIVGYVEQFENHSTRVTVRESLLFSARLRLDESTVTMHQVEQIVDDTLEMVELTSLQHSVVGEPGGPGLSIEQRKRMSIAVELVANPSVVFMDEPTSGLDARAAAIVMRAVKNVARSNRTVMTTVHQPSMEIFEAFDTLVLLQRGGRLTYFGSLGFESCDLIRYLEGCPGVEPIRPGYNPATWMLEVTGGSMSTMFASSSMDFPTLYQESELRKSNDAAMAELAAAKGDAPLAMTSRYATSYATQRKWLLRKWMRIYWHSPQYNFVRLLVTAGVALIYGLTYLGEGKLDPNGVEIANIQNIMGLTFSMAIFLGMLNCMTVMPLMAAERDVYYRERAIRMYSPFPYSSVITLAEIPYILAQTLLMVCITYWMVGYEATAWKFFYFLLLYFLTLTMYTCFGLLLTLLTPNQLMAQLLAAAFNQLWSFFNGFLIPYPSIPRGWKWMNRISPTSYILQGLAGSQLAGSNVPMTGFGGQQTTVGEFMESYFGYEASFLWWNVLIVFAYVLVFRVGAVLLLKYVSFERR